MVGGELAKLAKEVISQPPPAHRADEEVVGKLAALPKVCLTLIQSTTQRLLQLLQ
jgi:hypothetical protein